MNTNEQAALADLNTKLDQLIALVKSQPAPPPDNTADIQAAAAKVQAEIDALTPKPAAQ